MPEDNIPEAPPRTDDDTFDRAMDAIHSFELNQMSYQISLCLVCKERRIDMKLKPSQVCKWCNSDKSEIKMFSPENKMDPGTVPGTGERLPQPVNRYFSQVQNACNADKPPLGRAVLEIIQYLPNKPFQETNINQFELYL